MQLFGEIKKPRITIITSLYNGDNFIEGFMYDITRQTVFDQCELIIINAGSPGHEEWVIKRYMRHFKNIIYVKVQQDPGLYAVWNMGIRIARGEYIANANVDDRLAPDCYEKHMHALDENPDVDLVYSDYYMVARSNETWEYNTGRVWNFPEFSPKEMYSCLPNNHPMWRKSMNKKYGYFDENHKTAGDYEMWLRAVAEGAKFMKVPGVLGVFYINPKGLSQEGNHDVHLPEVRALREKYGYLWQD